MPAAVKSSVAKPKKRKAAAIADDGDGSAARVAPSGGDKKKKRKKNRPAGEDEGNLDLDVGLNLALASMDGQLLSDHLAQQVSRFGTDLSSVELADLHVPAGAIRDSSSFDKGLRSLENLPTFLEAFASGGAAELGAVPKEKGAPHTIVVTGAGLRAADLTRYVASLDISAPGCVLHLGGATVADTPSPQSLEKVPEKGQHGCQAGELPILLLMDILPHNWKLH